MTALSSESILFSSSHPRDPDLRLEESIDAVSANNSFRIRFSLPPMPADGAQNHLVIMVNGFAEWTDQLYHDPECGLGKLFADAGFASALLPIPFHLHRIPDIPKFRRASQHFAARKQVENPTGLFGVPAYIVGANKDRF